MNSHSLTLMIMSAMRHLLIAALTPLFGFRVHAQPEMGAIDRARQLEAEGEGFYALSDIGEAQRLWNDALRTRQRAFGDSSAEAAVGYAYQARYHSYMAASQLDHKLLARQQAERAKRMLRTDPGHVASNERIHILREFAYAFKVSEMGGALDDHTRLARTRALFQKALLAANDVGDTVRLAQIHHDIGNTFTDEVGRYNQELPQSGLQVLTDSALLHYRRSTALLNMVGRGLSEAVMMDHLTTGLLYQSAFRGDSSVQAVAAYDRALRIMLQSAGRLPDADPLAFEHRIANKAQMVELLYLRSFCFVVPHDVHTDSVSIRKALQSLEAAVPYWEAMLTEYRSRDIHKVIGSYSHFPFNYGTYLAAEHHLLTGDSTRLQQALRWSDLNRNGTEQRDRLQRGSSPNASVGLEPSLLAMRMPPGTACISYHTFPRAMAFVIDEHGARIVRLEQPKEEPMRYAARTQDLMDDLRANKPTSYAHRAHEIYRRLLEPVIKDDYDELVIVPAGTMEQIPFEALVRDTTRGSRWGDLNYVLRSARIRYARTIQEALRPSATLSLENGQWAIAQSADRAVLPFAQNLVERLAQAHSDSAAISGLDSESLAKLMRGPGLLHLASHAEAPTGPDELPFIALSDGAFPLSTMDGLRCENPLVVLSTCSSGEGRAFIGEGGLSFGRAFLRSGPRAVVHTAWPVDDLATSELLANMYERIDDGASVGAALLQAKLDFLDRHIDSPLANPIYWSGVMVVGQDLTSTGDDGNRLWLIALGASLLIGALLYRRLRRSRARAAM